MLKIVFIISSLSIGGAERVVCRLTEFLAGRGHDVSVLHFQLNKSTDSYDVDRQVRELKTSGELVLQNQRLKHLGQKLKLIPGGKFFISLVHYFVKIKNIRKTVTAFKPDIVVSFIDINNIISLAALAFTGIPLIISERVLPSEHKLAWYWKLLRTLSYPFCGALVVVTKDCLKCFSAKVRLKTFVIPNPAPIFETNPEIAEDNKLENKKVIAMGRLVPQKGFDLLIRAFSELREYENWTLTIWGEGSDRKNLESLIEELGMNARINLPGITEKPAEKFIGADVFVLSSRFEGFPNALLEAMSCGLPVISFDCPSGPADIIRPGVDGLLVEREDVRALKEAMERLIVDQKLRKELARRAIEVNDRFHISKVGAIWEEVIDEILQNK